MTKTLTERLAARPARVWFGDGVIACALCLFAVDGYFNWRFNTAMATDEADKLAMGIAGIAIAAALATLAIGKRFLDPRQQAGAKRKAMFLIALFAAWGVWSAMGQISAHRGDTVGTRKHEQQTYADNAAELPKLRAERDGIKARPAAQVQAAIDQLKAKNPAAMEMSSGCAKPERSPVCSRIKGLEAELGAAQRREKLDDRIAGMQAANAAAKGSVNSDADPQAQAAKTVISLFGVNANADTIAKLAPVLLSIVLLLGGWWGMDIGFLIRGVEFTGSHDGNDKTKAPLPSNISQFPGTHTVIVEKSDDKLAGRVQAYARAIQNLKVA